MPIDTRMAARIREPSEADPCSPCQADKSASRSDGFCKIPLYGASVCWPRTVHRHTASEVFHYPTDIKSLSCQADSWRVPITTVEFFHSQAGQRPRAFQWHS